MTLLIMAAGIGSRFGHGVKQLTPVGPNGELIIDYSIHDAIEAGFTKIIFIIRKDIELYFKDVIGNRIERICNRLGIEVAYAFQELNDLPIQLEHHLERTKPWGTGHAVLAARNLIDGPFAVINADDYYGKRAFVLMCNHLKNCESECLIGYLLKNTLSQCGGVTRGICSVDDKYKLTQIVETKDIVLDGDRAVANNTCIPLNYLVSMNMWGFRYDFLKLLESEFIGFLKSNKDKLKEEYLLPVIIGDLIKANKIDVKVLRTDDVWFGVTYQNDRSLVEKSIRRLIDSGIYIIWIYIEIC